MKRSSTLIMLSVAATLLCSCSPSPTSSAMCTENNTLCQLSSAFDGSVTIFCDRRYIWSYREKTFEGLVRVDYYAAIKESVLRGKGFQVYHGVPVNELPMDSFSKIQPEIGGFWEYIRSRHKAGYGYIVY